MKDQDNGGQRRDLSLHQLACQRKFLDYIPGIFEADYVQVSSSWPIHPSPSPQDKSRMLGPKISFLCSCEKTFSSVGARTSTLGGECEGVELLPKALRLSSKLSDSPSDPGAVGGSRDGVLPVTPLGDTGVA